IRPASAVVLIEAPPHPYHEVSPILSPQVQHSWLLAHAETTDPRVPPILRNKATVLSPSPSLGEGPGERAQRSRTTPWDPPFLRNKATALICGDPAKLRNKATVLITHSSALSTQHSGFSTQDSALSTRQRPSGAASAPGPFR